MTSLFRRNCLFLLLSLLVISTPSWGAMLIYFWYDENNLINFASQRPHDYEPVYTVEMPTFTSEQAAKLEQKPLSYEALFAAASAEQAVVEEQLLARQVVAQLKQECVSAKAMRETLINTRRVRMVGEDGQRSDMSYEEKMAEVAKLDKRIATSCQP